LHGAKVTQSTSSHPRGIETPSPMETLPPPQEQWPQLVEFFAENGFCVIRGVLDRAEIDAMRVALAESRASHPESWLNYGCSRDGGPVGESGRWQSADILQHATAFDSVVAHPSVLPLVRQLLGDPCTQGVGACIRDPVHDPAPAPGETWPLGTDAVAPWPEGSEIHWAMFHREMGGLHLPSHPLACPSVQVRFQLDDCDSSTHTVRHRRRRRRRRRRRHHRRRRHTLPASDRQAAASSYGATLYSRSPFNPASSSQMSTVPESVEAKRALPTEPRGDSEYKQITGQFIEDSWRNMHLPEAVDIHVSAGDVIILNNSNIHCGTVRRTDKARRDVNVHYGHKGLSLSGSTSYCI
jgi:hypothetical protein